MSHDSYAMKKAARTRNRGPLELEYADMRRALEQHLEQTPPENGRFVQLVTEETRLREALSQRASVRQFLDVMEQRWPYPAQRICLVKRIVEALGDAGLRAVIRQANQHDLDQSTGRAAPPEVSSMSAQPSLPTMPPLPRAPSVSTSSSTPVASSANPQLNERCVAIDVLSELTRGQSRSLAYQLGMAVGAVDDIERIALSSSEFSRRVLEYYFDRPRLHRGGIVNTLVEALRKQGMNMTADNLAERLLWES